ncbi:MAG: hypothetical protein INR65_07490 [Gluconacetobacter diazotrophicus]|nr:hypothetical protein [Gluconacetobacter diazotrophicus]
MRGGALACVLVAAAAWIPPERAAARCVRTVIAVPILSTDGAVVVPVEVDGVAAAAEIAPRDTMGVVIDTGGLRFQSDGSVRIGELDGDTVGSRTRIRRLQLGDAVAEDVPAVMTGRVRLPEVAGRRIMLQIGADILDAYQVLMDLPGRRLTLFTDEGTGCPDPVRAAAGHAVPLREGAAGQLDRVDAVLDGHALSMEINLSANDSVVGLAEAERFGAPDAVLAADPKVRTGLARALVGRRHRFASLRVAGYEVADGRVDVQPGVAYDVLGLDFFQNRVTLFDFPGRRMVVGEIGRTGSAVPDPPRASMLSTVRTRSAEATAAEEPAPPHR